jgi:hypothetical protein
MAVVDGVAERAGCAIGIRGRPEQQAVELGLRQARTEGDRRDAVGKIDRADGRVGDARDGDRQEVAVAVGRRRDAQGGVAGVLRDDESPIGLGDGRVVSLRVHSGQFLDRLRTMIVQVGRRQHARRSERRGEFGGGAGAKAAGGLLDGRRRGISVAGGRGQKLIERDGRAGEELLRHRTGQHDHAAVGQSDDDPVALDVHLGAREIDGEVEVWRPIEVDFDPVARRGAGNRNRRRRPRHDRMGIC